MADVFVDLLYRGLALGSRVRLGDVSGARGYLEVPAPMPVGTLISLVTGDEVVGALPAKVLEVVEQTAGSERPPGMVVRPTLDGEAARAWWRRLGGDSTASQAGSAVATKAPEAAAPVSPTPRSAAEPAPPSASPLATASAQVEAATAPPTVAPMAPSAAAAPGPVPDAPSVPDAAASSGALDRGGVVSAVLDDQPTMPTEVGLADTPPSEEPEAGEASSAEDAEAAELGAGDSAELAPAEGAELPEPPSVAESAPRGRKRRRNRR